MRKTLVQTILAAFCAILCALSSLGGGGMIVGARTAAWAKSGTPLPYARRLDYADAGPKLPNYWAYDGHAKYMVVFGEFLIEEVQEVEIVFAKRYEGYQLFGGFWRDAGSSFESVGFLGGSGGDVRISELRSTSYVSFAVVLDNFVTSLQRPGECKLDSVAKQVAVGTSAGLFKFSIYDIINLNSNNCSSCSIKSVRLKAGGVNLVDAIPVVDANGVVCWYNRYNGELRYTEGGGELIGSEL